MNGPIYQLFRTAPQLDVDHDHRAAYSALRLRQRTERGDYVQAMLSIPYFEIVNNMPARVVLDRLNRQLAREIADGYENFLRTAPYV